MTRRQWLTYCEKIIAEGRVTPQEAVAYVRHLYYYEKLRNISKRVNHGIQRNSR